MTTRSVQPPRTAYTAQEVAASTGLTYRQVLAMCHRGEIRSRRAGRYVLIPVKALDEFLADADHPAGVS